MDLCSFYDLSGVIGREPKMQSAAKKADAKGNFPGEGTRGQSPHGGGGWGAESHVA